MAGDGDPPARRGVGVFVVIFLVLIFVVIADTAWGQRRRVDAERERRLEERRSRDRLREELRRHD